MNNIKIFLGKQKRGAASLYLVLFSTIALSVIAVGFARDMLSGNKETSNNDLTQSAYDAAMAGLEDAKIALVKYHDCLNNGATAKEYGNTCEKIVFNMRKAIAEQSCEAVAKTLNRPLDQNRAVLIQEKNEGNGSDVAKSFDQAYTCVKIAEQLADYRSFLDSQNRLRVVPLRSLEEIEKGRNEMQAVKVRWHSNRIAQGQNAPLLKVQFLQTNADYFTIGELTANNGRIGTNRTVSFLQPNYYGGDNLLPENELLSSTNKSKVKALHDISCSQHGDVLGYHCEAILDLPEPYRGGNRAVGSSFLVVSLPLGTPSTDFTVVMCGDVACSNHLTFAGVQASVDSTGRASDKYRRIESRIELIDTNFPYPEFALQLEATDESFGKHFDITYNCWAGDKGNMRSCDNNRNVQ